MTIGKRLQAALAAGVLTTSLLGVAVAVAPSAGALSTYHPCNDYYSLVTGGYLVDRPGYWVGSTATADCYLSEGNTGNGVKALQQNLNYCYSAGLVVDGKYGALTTAAVTNVQRKVGATADGKYGPETRSLMNFAFRNYPSGGFHHCARIG
jgi:Putative peptidoglycan binding domain